MRWLSVNGDKERISPLTVSSHEQKGRRWSPGVWTTGLWIYFRNWFPYFGIICEYGHPTALLRSLNQFTKREALPRRKEWRLLYVNIYNRISNHWPFTSKLTSGNDKYATATRGDSLGWHMSCLVTLNYDTPRCVYGSSLRIATSSLVVVATYTTSTLETAVVSSTHHPRKHINIHWQHYSGQVNR